MVKETETEIKTAGMETKKAATDGCESFGQGVASQVGRTRQLYAELMRERQNECGRTRPPFSNRPHA